MVSQVLIGFFNFDFWFLKKQPGLSSIHGCKIDGVLVCVDGELESSVSIAGSLSYPRNTELSQKH